MHALSNSKALSGRQTGGENIMNADNYMDPTTAFFTHQTVFLTGATGGLGGCLLYKLAVVLHVPRIFVLIRAGAEAAIRRWTATMPAQVDAILATGAVRFVSGDITKPHLGISAADLATLAPQVTVVINSAANISLRAPLPVIVHDNTLSALALAELAATSFPRLTRYVQLSSVFAFTFMPDGPLREEFYRLHDPSQMLANILSGAEQLAGLDGGGTISSNSSNIKNNSSSSSSSSTSAADAGLDGFPWPYALSKLLMESLLADRFAHRLPLLVVRPSCIGPALREPYEQYRPAPSVPLDGFISRLMRPGPAMVFRAAAGSASGTNIVDEVPVDLVANMLLQHVCRGTRGVAHAASLLYVPRTLDRLIADTHRHVDTDWRARLPRVVFTRDAAAPQCPLAEFYRVHNRDWRFCTDRSRDLDVGGPVGMGWPEGHEPDGYMRRRVRGIFRETKEMLARREWEKNKNNQRAELMKKRQTLDRGEAVLPPLRKADEFKARL